MWNSGIGLGWVLVCFAGLCVVAIVFVFWFLPETKGIPVEEVVECSSARPSRRDRVRHHLAATT